MKDDEYKGVARESSIYYERVSICLSGVEIDIIAENYFSLPRFIVLITLWLIFNHKCLSIAIALGSSVKDYLNPILFYRFSGQ